MQAWQTQPHLVCVNVQSVGSPSPSRRSQSALIAKMGTTTHARLASVPSRGSGVPRTESASVLQGIRKKRRQPPNRLLEASKICTYGVGTNLVSRTHEIFFPFVRNQKKKSPVEENQKTEGVQHRAGEGGAELIRRQAVVVGRRDGQCAVWVRPKINRRVPSSQTPL